MATLDSSYLRGYDRRRGTVYPSPFFDIAQTYMPPTVKELFRWCQYFFYKDPMIGAVVTKIAEGTQDKMSIDVEKLREMLGKPRYGYREEIEGAVRARSKVTGVD